MVLGHAAEYRGDPGGVACEELVVVRGAELAHDAELHYKLWGGVGGVGGDAWCRQENKIYFMPNLVNLRLFNQNYWPAMLVKHTALYLIYLTNILQSAQL